MGGNESEWTRKVEFREEEIGGSRQSMHGYILVYPRLKREKLSALGSQQMGP